MTSSRAAIGLICGAMFTLCHGWWGDGHHILTRAAVQALGDSVPAFFTQGEALIAHCAVDPDVVKNNALPHIREAESPEHFLDLELLKGTHLPRTRKEFVRTCVRLGVAPESVGFLPYAAIEWTERLAAAFAEHRKWPDNPHIRTKCLVYAGNLAHYAQDLCQPLHLTIHYDGRAKPDNSSPHSGIHNKVDGLVENLRIPPSELTAGTHAHGFQSAIDSVVAIVYRSYSLVDSVYALEPRLSIVSAKKTPPEVRAFTVSAATRATELTASLFVTAWHMSATVKLEQWLDRAKLDGTP